jgi:hypothetical protein
MVAIVAPLVQYVAPDQQTAGKTDGHAADIKYRSQTLTAQATEGDLQVVEQHGRRFLIGG